MFAIIAFVVIAVLVIGSLGAAFFVWLNDDDYPGTGATGGGVFGHGPAYDIAIFTVAG